MGSLNQEDCNQLFDVVISGIGGVFPESNDIDEFKQHLFNKVNLVTENECRWDPAHWKNIPNATGKVKTTRKLDAPFFGLLRVIANYMEPMIRISLEKGFEAIVDAGVNPSSLNGGNTAVYSCSSNSEDEAYTNLTFTPCTRKAPWLLTHAHTFLSNRISNTLNLHGTSVSTFSSWTGGLENLIFAVDDIRSGRVKNALVIVSNVVRYPEIMRLHNGLKVLSQSGETKSFDEAASGYGRSEGSVAFFLQRSGETKKEYAKIVHVNISQGNDVPRKLLSVAPESFENFLNQFYSDCKISPLDVSFLEAYGCGVPKIDEVELNVVTDFFCKNRHSPLKIGSVKSNAGHAEVASSFFSLAKALVCLDTGFIAPNINYSTPNSKVPGLIDGRLKVVTEKTILDGNYVAVNCFNLFGGMGHVLLERRKPKKLSTFPHNDFPRLVLFSARHEEGINEVMSKIESAPLNPDYHDLIQRVFTENLAGHFFRGYTILPNSNPPNHGSLEQSSDKRPVWFVCTGMGCQWTGMAAELMSFPVFAKSLHECASILKPFGLDLINIVTSIDQTTFDVLLNSFVGITAYQIALVDLLFAVGIKPDGMLGHSLGETCCAYIDGCFTKQQTLMSSYFRGKLLEEIAVPQGLMVAVGANHKDLLDLPPTVSVGCRNSSTSCTLSGLAEDLQDYCLKLKERNIFHKIVQTGNRAFHCEYIKPIGEEFKRRFGPYVLHPKKRSSKWISSSVPEENWSSELAQYASVAYQHNNIVSCVLFDSACSHIPENAIVIEIGPHGLLQSILTKALPPSCINLPLMKRKCGDQVNFLLSALGKFHNAGIKVNLDALYPPPNFPITSSTPSLAALMTWDHSDEWTDTPRSYADAKTFNFSLSNSKFQYLLSHQIGSKIILPTSFLLIKVLDYLYQIEANNPSSSSMFLLENITVYENLAVNVDDDVEIIIQRNKANGNFELSLDDSRLLLNGVLNSVNAVDENSNLMNSWYNNNMHRFSSLSSHHEDNTCVEKSDIYSMLENAGIYLCSPFNLIERIIFNKKECLVSVRWTNDKLGFLDAILKIQVILDLLGADFAPLLPCHFQHLMLNFADLKNVPEGSFIPVLVDMESHRIETKGVTLLSVKTAALKIEENLEIQADTLGFIPQINPPMDTLEQFLDLCLQLISDVISPDLMNCGTCIHVLKYRSTNGISDQILQTINSITNRLSDICVDLQIVDDIENLPSLVKHDCMVLDDGPILDSVFKTFRSGFLLLTLSGEDCLSLDNDTSLLTEKFINGKRYFLLKKITRPKAVKILKMHESGLDLRLIEENRANHDGELVVVWEKLINVDPLKILYQARKLGTLKRNVRFVFILDSNARPFSLDDSFYHQRLKCGFFTNILAQGQWGSLNYAPVFSQDCQSLKNQSISLHAASKRFFSAWKYISINLTDLTIDQSSEREEAFRFIDYVGLDSEGDRIMGLAYFNEHDSSVDYDPVLNWLAPEDWSDEDLSTIPYLYSLAYYMLSEVPRLNIKGRLVLILGGNSALGHAAICVALELGAVVLTTVESPQEAAILFESFPQLKESQVFMLDCTLDFKIKKLIKGHELFVIINPYSGRVFQTSLNLRSTFGVCIQLGCVEMKKGKKIGMNTFLRDGSLSGLSDLDFSNCSEEIKWKIHSFIAEKLKSSSLKPLPRTVFDGNDKSAVFKYLTKKNQGSKAVISMQNYRDGDNILSRSTKTYLIIASKDSMWLQLVTRLLKLSVEQIVIALNGNVINKMYEHQLYQLMKKCSRVSFLLLPDTDLDTIKGTQIMFKAVCDLGPPDVILCLSIDKTKLSNIDSVTRKIAHPVQNFICIFSEAEELCHNRTMNGFPSLNVESKNSEKHLKYFLPHLDNILDHFHARKETVWSSSIIINKLESRGLKSDDLKLLLPSSVLDLVDLSNEQSQVSEFVEVTTKSCRFKDSKECDSLFFIPGFSSKSLKQIFKGLTYPAFCATPTTYTESAEAMAYELFQSIKQIQPNGMYAIVAETWGMCVAVELGLLLENDGDKVKLILIDGTPETIKQLLIDFNLNAQSLNHHQNLTMQLLKFEEVNLNALATQIISNSSNGCSSGDKEKIKSSLLSVQSKLIAAQLYEKKPQSLKGEVLIVKQRNSASEICSELRQNVNENQTIYFTSETSYTNLVNGPEIVSIINENQFVNWF